MTEKEWPRKTVEFGSVKVTVERRTVLGEIVYHSVLAALPRDEEHPILNTLREFFALIVAQTVETEGLDIALPSFGAPDEELVAAFEAFKNMDAYLMSKWVDEIFELNRPPNAQEFWPSHKLPEAERKNPVSAGSSGKAKSGATSESTTETGP